MSTIDKLQNDLSNWYADSPIREYMGWWKTGLKSFVPVQHQQKLFAQVIQIYLTQEPESAIKVWIRSGKSIVHYNPETNQEDEPAQWWHQVQHIINQADGKKTELKFLLSKHQTLVRKIALPQAAKENLDEVIGYELDKYVPFKAEQVYLAYKIDKDNQNEEKILLDLVVVTKQKLTTALNLCEEKSIALDGIDVNQSYDQQPPKCLGVNLLPQEHRRASNFFNLKLNLALLTLLIGLTYFVMYTSIANKQGKIERLTNINAKLQKQAKQSKLLRKELKATIVSSKFLQNKKQDNPNLVALLSEITSILPDHTYLTRVKVDQEKVEIAGLSDNANSLIPKLNKSSNWFAPEPVGGFSEDRITKKEKFTIQALLREPQLEDADAVNS